MTKVYIHSSSSGSESSSWCKVPRPLEGTLSSCRCSLRLPSSASARFRSSDWRRLESGEERGLTSVIVSSDSSLWLAGTSLVSAEPTGILLPPGDKEDLLGLGRLGEPKLFLLLLLLQELSESASMLASVDVGDGLRLYRLLIRFLGVCLFLPLECLALDDKISSSDSLGLWLYTSLSSASLASADKDINVPLHIFDCKSKSSSPSLRLLMTLADGHETGMLDALCRSSSLEWQLSSFLSALLLLLFLIGFRCFCVPSVLGDQTPFVFFVCFACCHSCPGLLCLSFPIFFPSPLPMLLSSQSLSKNEWSTSPSRSLGLNMAVFSDTLNL